MSYEGTYAATWNFIGTFREELNIYQPLWPEVDQQEYEVEINSLVWLTPKQIDDLVKFIDSKVESDITSIDTAELAKLAPEYLAAFQAESSVQIAKPKSFSKSKYKISFKKNKATAVPKIFKIFEQESYGNQCLVRRLSQKYGIDEATAKSWKIEFVKFLTLLIIETDAEVTSNSFPSSVVEQVWNTFTELGYYYRQTFTTIFGESYPTPESVLTSSHAGAETAQRYADTVKLYTEIFTEEPSSSVWEGADQRFQSDSAFLEDDNNRRLAVNVYRLLVSRAIEKVLDTSNNLELVVFDGIEGKGYLKSDPEVTTARENAAKSGELYGWRANYPHFSNVYFRNALSAGKYFPNKYSEGYDSAIALASGGYLFYLNPFNDLTLQLAQLPKLPEVKDKNLDDIADFAETSHNFE